MHSTNPGTPIYMNGDVSNIQKRKVVPLLHLTFNNRGTQDISCMSEVPTCKLPLLLYERAYPLGIKMSIKTIISAYYYFKAEKPSPRRERKK